MEKEKLFYRVKITLKYIVNLIISSVYIKKCHICLENITDYNLIFLCNECRTEIEKRGKYHCFRCGNPVDENTLICGQCSLKEPPYFRHISYGIYHGKLRKLILLYKLSEIDPLKKYISEIFLFLYDNCGIGECDIVMTVPQDPGRKKKFYPLNQIAGIIAEKRKIKLSTGNLIKIRHTEKQTSLNYNKRKKNLNGVFKLLYGEDIKGKTVLLLDDVYTTGTTVKKCTVLLNKYAKKVIVITIAQSPKVLKV